MIKSGSEYPADCKCEKPAFHRELAVIQECQDGCAVSARRIAYDTHAACLTDDEHHSRLKELDEFGRKLHELAHQVNEEIPKMKMGLIRGIDFSIEVAQACDPLGKIRPLVDVSGFGQRTELVLGAIDIGAATVEGIHAVAVEAAKGMVAQFKVLADAGQVL